MLDSSYSEKNFKKTYLKKHSLDKKYWYSNISIICIVVGGQYINNEISGKKRFCVSIEVEHTSFPTLIGNNITAKGPGTDTILVFCFLFSFFSGGLTDKAYIKLGECS